MDTILAFAMGQKHKDKTPMIFDWIKAARIILERKPKVASAGLRGDWEYTGGVIWEDGGPVSSDETYTFLESTWAVPELSIDGEIMECYIMEDDLEDLNLNWGAKTYWPVEAMSVIKGE